MLVCLLVYFYRHILIFSLTVARTTHKSVIGGENIEEIPEKDKNWKIPVDVSIPEIGKKRKRPK